jgi:hypothetical protein
MILSLVFGRKYIISFLRALWSTSSLELSIGVDVLRKAIFKVLNKLWLEDMNSFSIFGMNQTITNKVLNVT